MYLLMDLLVSIRYVIVDSNKNRRNFVIAVITVLIVVTTIVYLAPVPRLI